ncbi:MAG: hypothetical protein H0W57_13375 [Rubrobacteraceae bacterium]|jgi:hypothetical protein|nr:hypothetical protein [Rubrobacteraceae bacterium]
MMSEQQFETILAAIADVQVAVDALGLDMQRVLEIVAWTDTDCPQPPEWANGGAEDAAGGTEEDILRTDPPPSEARGNVGAAAGLLVIAAVVVVAVFVALYLLGN